LLAQISVLQERGENVYEVIGFIMSWPRVLLYSGCNVRLLQYMMCGLSRINRCTASQFPSSTTCLNVLEAKTGLPVSCGKPSFAIQRRAQLGACF
jgi:hypothetical protein